MPVGWAQIARGGEGVRGAREGDQRKRDGRVGGRRVSCYFTSRPAPTEGGRRRAAHLKLAEVGHRALAEVGGDRAGLVERVDDRLLHVVRHRHRALVRLVVPRHAPRNRPHFFAAARARRPERAGRVGMSWRKFVSRRSWARFLRLTGGHTNSCIEIQLEDQREPLVCPRRRRSPRARHTEPRSPDLQRRCVPRTRAPARTLGTSRLVPPAPVARRDTTRAVAVARLSAR